MEHSLEGWRNGSDWLDVGGRKAPHAAQSVEAANMRSVGTKLTLKDHERLLKYCADLRLSRYFLLQSLILEQLDAYDDAAR